MKLGPLHVHDGTITFVPCLIRDFRCLRLSFQKKHVGWVESVEVEHVSKIDRGFEIMLSTGERVVAAHVVVALGYRTLLWVTRSAGNVSRPRGML